MFFAWYKIYCMRSASIFRSFGHLSSTQQKRQIRSEQCMSSKLFYRSWFYFYFLSRVAQMSKWVKIWSRPHASNYLSHKKNEFCWIFLVFVLIFSERGCRWARKQKLPSYSKINKIYKCLLQKLWEKDKALILLRTFLRHKVKTRVGRARTWRTTKNK